jgi:hypothetical protein
MRKYLFPASFLSATFGLLYATATFAEQWSQEFVYNLPW